MQEQAPAAPEEHTPAETTAVILEQYMDTEILSLTNELNRRFNKEIYVKSLQLIKLDSPGAPFWHSNIFIGIANEAIKLQFHLKRAYAESEPNYLCWAARTLLELRVWALYIVRSEANAKRFHQDQYIDGLTALGAMDKAATKVTTTADRTLLTTAAQTLRAQFTPKTDEAGVGKSDGYLSPRAVAKEVGIELEFDLHNMFTSKLVHATGYSVLVAPDDDSKRLIMDWTFKYAAQNALSILDTLNARLKDLGLPMFI
jgi:hypothetical protein